MTLYFVLFYLLAFIRPLLDMIQVHLHFLFCSFVLREAV